MPFKKGESGNPRGRPRGVTDKRTKLRALLEPHAEELVAKAVERALSGDSTALRLCLERLIPPQRATDGCIRLGTTPDSPSALSQGLLSAMAPGKLSPSETVSALQAVTAHLRIREAEDLEARVARLEEDAREHQAAR